MATQAMILLVFVALIGVTSAQTSLSEEDKQLLLDLHNNERSTVNPSASNMESMVRVLPTVGLE